MATVLLRSTMRVIRPTMVPRRWISKPSVESELAGSEIVRLLARAVEAKQKEGQPQTDAEWKQYVIGMQKLMQDQNCQLMEKLDHLADKMEKDQAKMIDAIDKAQRENQMAMGEMMKKMGWTGVRVNETNDQSFTKDAVITIIQKQNTMKEDMVSLHTETRKLIVTAEDNLDTHMILTDIGITILSFVIIGMIALGP